jgi:hypothetical protein
MSWVIWGLIPDRKNRFICSRAHWLWGPTMLLFNVHSGVFPRSKVAEVLMDGAIPLLPLYALMICTTTSLASSKISVHELEHYITIQCNYNL